MASDPARRSEPTPSQRLYRWLSDDVNTVIVLYVIAAILAIGSVGSFMLGVGRGGTATDVQLVMVLASAAILLYLAIASAGYEE